MQSDKNVEWVSNGYETPTHCYPFPGQTDREARNSHWSWRRSMRVGDPKATEDHSVEALKSMGVIGLYRNV